MCSRMGKREILHLRLSSEALLPVVFFMSFISISCVDRSRTVWLCLIFSFSRYYCSFSKWCAGFFSHSRIKIPAPVSSLPKVDIDDHDWLSSFSFFPPVFPVHVKCLFWLSFSLWKLVAFSYSCWPSVYLLSPLSLPPMRWSQVEGNEVTGGTVLRKD